MSDHTETLAQRDARINAWLSGVSPGDIVTVRLNSTDILTGKVYEAPDDTQRAALYVYTTLLRHGNGYPGGSFEPVTEPVSDHTATTLTEAERAQIRDAIIACWQEDYSAAMVAAGIADALMPIVAARVAAARADERAKWESAEMEWGVTQESDGIVRRGLSEEAARRIASWTDPPDSPRHVMRRRLGPWECADDRALIEGADQ